MCEQLLEPVSLTVQEELSALAWSDKDVIIVYFVLVIIYALINPVI